MRPLAALVLALTLSFAVLAQQRFDFKVREDMFAGMDGDTAAFDRAMKLIAETLAADPNHAEALVWRGDGRLFLAGQAFQRGAFREGQTLSAEGLADMERAVALAASQPRWNRMGEHGRGELLGALADGWLTLGETAKANAYLDRMTGELPGTAYAKNAATRRADPAAKVPLTCLGCH